MLFLRLRVLVGAARVRNRAAGCFPALGATMHAPLGLSVLKPPLEPGRLNRLG